MDRADEGGTFEKISFSLLLIRALDKRWTGTLAVDPPTGGQQVLQLDRGLVCRVLVPDDYARFGSIIVDAGVASEAELDRATEGGGLMGEALVAANLIDSKTLQRALVLQLLNRLVRIFGYPVETKWGYGSALSDFDERPKGVRIDTLRVLWAGITSHGETGKWLQATIDHIGESPFQVRQNVNVKRFGFSGDARRVVRVVQTERCTLNELTSRRIAPDDVVRQIVYLLAATRHLDFSPVGAAAAEGDSSMGEEPTVDLSASSDEWPVAPEARKEDATEDAAPTPQRRVARIKLRRVAVQRGAAPDKPGTGEPIARAIRLRRSKRSSSDAAISSGSAATGDAANRGRREQLMAEMKTRLTRLEGESPFALLELKPADLEGIEEAAVTDVLWAAYERCAKRWHPDGCPSELSELREGMTKIYDTITDAFRLLADPTARANVLAGGAPVTVRSSTTAPDKLAAEPPEPPESGERALDNGAAPAQLHERALIALSEQRFEEALRLCSAARDRDPDHPDYAATAAWIRSAMPDADPSALIADLDEVIRRHPQHVAGRYYRGVLRRRTGAADAARRDFKLVLQLEPGHSGARNNLDELRRPSKRRS